MKPWAKWTLLIGWTLLLLLTAQMWNPFTSFPALLKYSVVSVISSALFGALVILIQYYLLISIIFPLPPRADSKAPQSIWKRMFPFLFKKPPINPKAPKTLEELIGNVQAKQEIREVIDMIVHPDNYSASGAEVPKGMLFVGPPGVGKTLFARAIANEIGIPFYVVEASGLSGLIMGLGVLKLKTLFRKLRKHERAILFIDEIDSIGGRRTGDKGFGGQSDMNMTLNTLLTEMDGFSGNNVLVIGATNNDGILDPALMRAGRMDRRIYFQLPDPNDRKELFRYYLSKMLCAEGIDYEELEKMTVNFSPAEIANVVNEAALICRRPGGPGKVTMDTIDQALTRIAVGLERSMVGSGVEHGSADASIRLDDVIGIDEVKQDILEVIDFLKHGDELRKIGARIPKGVLLIGPPGVGKTMLAKAIANEAGVPFYALAGSYFQSMWAGVGSDRVRALYSQARKSPAAIVFIDEIDALGATRGVDTGGGAVQDHNKTLNQFLTELDGVGRSNVITIGSTNMEAQLDPAFMRSGRFDRKCYIGLPDGPARKKIFQKYLKNIKLASEPDLDKLGKQTTNFSGADIAACVNEAAILAVRKGKQHVEECDLEDAVDRISVTAGHKLNTEGMNLSRVADISVRLSDIKGMEEAKAEAAEVVALLQHADNVRDMGLKAPKGILLVGPPGTGKTMLAKAIANEAGVPFYAVSGGDFQSKWAGVGATRVRAVYEQARRSGKPAIVFIDEIDAIGAKRGVDYGGGAVQDSNKTLNQLLVELDGFGKHKVLTIGASNHPDLLDPALLRPGRFDRRIEIKLPNLEGREAILKHYLNELKLDDNLNVLDIARMTVFKSGADLANIVNEAGLIAIREGRTDLVQSDLIQAIQRVSFGMSYSRNVLKDELLAIAYHEAGHTLVCYFRDQRQKLQVVTIVPSGYALGYMWGVEKEDYQRKSRNDYLVDIEISLGSYAAEELILEDTCSGVSGDLQHAAHTARRMVREFGMGRFKLNVDVGFGAENQGPSQQTEREIEQEITQIVDKCLDNARALVKAKRQELDRLAHLLMEKETLYYPDIAACLEPQRSLIDIEREMLQMSERRLVGKPPVINLGAITSGAKGASGSSTPAGSGPSASGLPDNAANNQLPPPA